MISDDNGFELPLFAMCLLASAIQYIDVKDNYSPLYRYAVLFLLYVGTRNIFHRRLNL